MSDRQDNDAAMRTGLRDLARPRLADEVREVLVARLRAGLWLILAANLMFVVVDIAVQDWSTLRQLVPIKLFQMGVIATVFLLIRRDLDRPALQRIAVTAIALIAFTPSASGMIRGDVTPTIVLLLALCMGTASLVPLGTIAQAAITGTVAFAILANASVVVGAGAVFGYEAAGVAAALAATILVAYEHERSRRDRSRMAALLDGQTRVLEMVATGRPLPEILEALTLLIEARSTGLRCSVLILEGDRLRGGAAPSLPTSYNQALDGMVIGPRVGCCGTAAFTRQPVVVSDTSTDPLWSAFLPLAIEYELRACWSSPILATDGRCLGTFAMYYREIRSPGPEEWELIDTATHLAGVAIERRQTEDALSDARTSAEGEARENARLVEELTHAGQLKSEFVSTMSHELRTPLSVILGYTDVLRDELHADEQHRTLDRIRRSGMELLDMIESTLDLNRLEAGKDTPECERVTVHPLIDDLAVEFEAMHATSETVIRWEPSTGVVLWTDQRKLKIILKNLIGNALKFTPCGEVVISCGEEAAGCVFRVRDTGVGISEEHLPHIFEMFRQGDGSDRRQHGGVGLGLYITRRLVAQLGGEIIVQSTLGEGSVFVVTLPSAASVGAPMLDA